MLQDVDTIVITNALIVLEELYMKKEGGFPLNQQIIMNLLSRLSEFSEWGLHVVIDLVTKYQAQREEEIFSIMNLLDPLLRTSNSGIILAVLKCFLTLTKTMPELHPQIYIRLKPPLLTMITGGTTEIQYSLLKHLEIILQKPEAKGIFDDEYRHLFIRYNEPLHIKYLKINIISMICNSNNVQEILSEMFEYVVDIDMQISLLTVTALGEIAMLDIPGISQRIMDKFMDYLELDVQYIRSGCLSTIAQILVVYPQFKIYVKPIISKYLRVADSSEMKAILIWMLGNFGEDMVEAPYLIEQYINNYTLDEITTEMKLQLLSASMKLFFKRAPEMYFMLGKLLMLGISDNSNQDVHDKALFYYRLLKEDIQLAEKMFSNIPSGFGSTEDDQIIKANRTGNIRKSSTLLKQVHFMIYIYIYFKFGFDDAIR